MTPHLLLRAHTDQRLGLGHVSRAFSIHEAWTALGGTAELAVSGDVRARSLGEGRHPWNDEPLPLPAHYLGEDLGAPVPEALKAKAQVALLDLWDTRPEHIAGLRPLKVGVLEDEGEGHEAADLLFQPYLEGVSWPQGPVRNERGRKLKPFETVRGQCLVLRGAAYIVVDSEIPRLRPKREPLQPLVVHKLLVTFGGTDGPGLSQRGFEVLRRLLAEQSWAGVCTLVAPRGVRGEGVPGLTVVESLPRLSRRIMDFDAVWCAGGVTLVNAACLGVPAAAWGQNERQHLAISDLAAANACFNLGLGPEEDLDHTVSALAQWLGPEGQDNRQEQTRDGRLLVDGGGAARIAKALWDLVQ